jgi:tetratricopeptide (TPR) repeat protein
MAGEIYVPGSNASGRRDSGMEASMNQVTVGRGTSSSSRMFQIVSQAVCLAVVVTAVAGISGCDKLRARDLLNKGVAAFKNAQFDSAVEDFKQAKALDPDLVNARLYLATAYASQYIPGAPSDENMRHGQEAIAEYKDVLDKDPNNLSAIDGLASILYQMAGQPFSEKLFEQSKEYHQKHIALHPNDPQPYYSIGVIDWALAYRGNTEMRLDYNKDHVKKQIKDTDPLPPDVRKQYTDKYQGMVDDGITALKKSIELKPDYDDAMTYLNLLYRRKADMAESQADRDNYDKMADDLLDKVKEIKQKRAEQPQPTT